MIGTSSSLAWIHIVSFHPRLAAIALACVTASTAFAQAIPTDANGFTAHVADLLRKEVGEAAVVVKAPLTLGVGELQANLERVFGYCSAAPVGCASELALYVQGAVEVHRERSAPPRREAVRLVLRSEAYLQQAQRNVPAGAPAMQPKPLVDGLVMLPVLDSPRTLRMLTDKDNAALGLPSSDAAIELALANTAAALKPLMDEAKVLRPGQIGQLVGHTYQPSRLAFHAQWAPLAQAQGGKLIVVAPVTDAVFYIADDSPEAADALRRFSRQLMGRAPNRLSDVLLRWTETGWDVLR